MVLVFFLLPVAAIFARVPIGSLLDQLSSDVVGDALRVTLKTNAVRSFPVRLDGRWPTTA